MDLLEEIIKHRTKIEEILQISDNDDEKVALLIDQVGNRQRLVSLIEQNKASLDLKYLVEHLGNSEFKADLVCMTVLGIGFYCAILVSIDKILQCDMSSSEKIETIERILASDAETLTDIAQNYLQQEEDETK